MQQKKKQEHDVLFYPDNILNHFWGYIYCVFSPIVAKKLWTELVSIRCN